MAGLPAKDEREMEGIEATGKGEVKEEIVETKPTVGKGAAKDVAKGGASGQQGQGKGGGGGGGGKKKKGKR